MNQAGNRVTAVDDVWTTDLATLRDVVRDRKALTERLKTCTPLERVWILTLLGGAEEAAAEGEYLLAVSDNRLQPLLALAYAYRALRRWHDAALLQEEALRLARTPAREAAVRYQIGRRLFEEARYRDSAAEFEWARDLYRTAGRRHSRAEAAEQAMVRAREIAAGAGIGIKA